MRCNKTSFLEEPTSKTNDGPSGWGLCLELTTLLYKKNIVMNISLNHSHYWRMYIRIGTWNEVSLYKFSKIK